MMKQIGSKVVSIVKGVGTSIKENLLLSLVGVSLLGCVIAFVVNRDWVAANQTFAVGVLTWIILIGGWSWAWLRICHIERDRQWNILMHIGERWSSAEMASARKLALTLGKQGIKKTLLPNGEWHKEGYFELVALGGFFEELGIAVKQHYIDAKLINKRIGGSIVKYYGLYKGYIDEIQQTKPTVYANFRDLAKEVEDLRKQTKKS